MHVTRYSQTVTVTIEFAYEERTVIEECRQSSYGQYWERSELTQPFSLEEIEMLRTTLGVCIGAEAADVNIFAITPSETVEDVPGGGKLRPIAESLYDDLSTVLTQWGRLPR